MKGIYYIQEQATNFKTKQGQDQRHGAGYVSFYGKSRGGQQGLFRWAYSIVMGRAHTYQLETDKQIKKQDVVMRLIQLIVTASDTSIPTKTREAVSVLFTQGKELFFTQKKRNGF